MLELERASFWAHTTKAHKAWAQFSNKPNKAQSFQKLHKADFYVALKTLKPKSLDFLSHCWTRARNPKLSEALSPNNVEPVPALLNPVHLLQKNSSMTFVKRKNS